MLKEQELSLEYNTQRSKLVISEYGRHIRKMIDQLMEIEDREKRNKLAKAVVTVMGQLVHPQNRDSAEIKNKLWDHLFILSDFKLDVDSPFPKPSPKELEERPERISYPSHNIKFGHYGKNIEQIIEKVKETEEGPVKDALIVIIANHLKKTYLNYNRDSVTDELIADHLSSLSGGKLILPADTKLSESIELFNRPKKKKFVPKQGQGAQNSGHGHSNPHSYGFQKKKNKGT